MSIWWHPYLIQHIDNGCGLPIALKQLHFIHLFFLRFYLFLEKGREGEREGEKHEYVVASHVPPTEDGGTWPATRACALTGNETGTFCFAGQHSVN